MSEEKLSHYRDPFKSDHLAVADIEELIEAGSNLILTIARVEQRKDYKVAGKKGKHNIAWFKEKDPTGKPMKPWVLNAGNTEIVKKFAGSGVYVEKWKKDIVVQLYLDPTAKFGGEVTGGIRIRTTQPRTTRQIITKADEQNWRNAVDAYKRDGDLAKVLKKVDISAEDQEAIIEIGKAELDYEISNNEASQ